MSIDTLIDSLWEQDPPRTAVGTVRTYISRLRRCLDSGTDGEIIKTIGDGYAFTGGSAVIDLDLFATHVQAAQKVRQADPAQAAAHLREALALWRGAPLAGIHGPFADAQRARLNELRIAAIEERLAIDIESGALPAAIAELRTLLREHPLRERLSELLMLALYRAGRQAEALAAFADIRRSLADELGVDPGSALTELHQRILRADSSLTSSAKDDSQADDLRPLVAPAQLPSDLRTFSGRQAELARISSLANEGSGSVQTAMIAGIDGMAGIGKTTLAVHWAHQIAGQYPDGQIYLNLRGFDSTSTVMTAAEALRSLLSSLGLPDWRIPDSLDAQVSVYRSRLSDKRVLVLLDNARDIDQVRPLLPTGAGSFAIVTSRNSLVGLAATEGAELITLGLPSHDAARETIERRLGQERTSAEPEAVEEIIRLCGRLPLAMAIVSGRAAARPAFPLSAIATDLKRTQGTLEAFYGASPVSDAGAVFSWSYDKLAPQAARLFRLLAILPATEFTAAASASMLGASLRNAKALITELGDAALLIEHQPGRYTFHDLLRAYATELSEAHDSPAERDEAVSRFAEHYLQSGYLAQVVLRPLRQPIAPPTPRAGIRPEQSPPDYQSAILWFATERGTLEAIIRQATDHYSTLPIWQLALTMQKFYQWQGRYQDWLNTTQLALIHAKRDSDDAAQGHVLRSMAGAYFYLGRHKESVDCLEQTEELYIRVGYRAELAYLHSNFGEVLSGQGLHEKAVQHYLKAMPLYRETDNTRGQAWALSGAGICYSQLGDSGAAISALLAALDLTDGEDNPHQEAKISIDLGGVYTESGQHAKAIGILQHVLEMLDKFEHRPMQADALRVLGDASCRMGNVEAARTAWRHARDLYSSLSLLRFGSEGADKFMSAGIEERLRRLSPINAESDSSA